MTFKLATCEDLIAAGADKQKARNAAIRDVSRGLLWTLGFAVFVFVSAYSILIAPDWVFWTYISSLIALVIWLFVRSERQ